MDIELFKKIARYNYKKTNLESNIKEIKEQGLKFARKIELSNYSQYQSFRKLNNIELNKEQSEKVGRLVLELLEEELKEINEYLDKVEITIR